jgi:hypothetical protein
MLVNVWNSLDFRMIYGFMDTYFQREFEQKSHKVHPSTNTSYSKSLIGVDTVSKLMYINSVLTPDTVMTLKETNVYKSTDTSQNRVVSTFHMEGTKIFHVPDVEEMFNLASIHKHEQSQDTRVGSKRRTDPSKEDMMSDIVQSVHNVTNSLELLSVPERMAYDGTVTMYTDENDRVCSMVMEMRAVDTSSSSCASVC